MEHVFPVISLTALIPFGGRARISNRILIYAFLVRVVLYNVSAGPAVTASHDHLVHCGGGGRAGSSEGGSVTASLATKNNNGMAALCGSKFTVVCDVQGFEMVSDKFVGALRFALQSEGVMHVQVPHVCPALLIANVADIGELFPAPSFDAVAALDAGDIVLVTEPGGQESGGDDVCVSISSEENDTEVDEEEHAPANADACDAPDDPPAAQPQAMRVQRQLNDRVPMGDTWAKFVGLP